MGITMSVAAIERLFVNLNKANVAAGVTAKTLGEGVTSLSAWTQAAAALDVKAEDITSAFAHINSQFQEFYTKGTSTMLPALKALFNIEGEKAPGVRKTTDELLLELADKIQGMDPQRAQYRLGELGLGQLYPMLSKGRGEIQRQRQLQIDAGNVVTPEAEGRSKALSLALGETGTRIMGIVRGVNDALAPAITNIVTQFNRWVEANKPLIELTLVEWITRLGRGAVQLAEDFFKFLNSEGFKGFVSDVGAVATAANTAAEAVGGWGRAIEILAGIWIGSKVLGMLANMATFLNLGGNIARTLGWVAVGNPVGAAVTVAVRARVKSISSPGPVTSSAASPTRPMIGSPTSRRRRAARSTSRLRPPPTRW